MRSPVSKDDRVGGKRWRKYHSDGTEVHGTVIAIYDGYLARVHWDGQLGTETIDRAQLRRVR